MLSTVVSRISSALVATVKTHCSSRLYMYKVFHFTSIINKLQNCFSLTQFSTGESNQFLLFMRYQTLLRAHFLSFSSPPKRSPFPYFSVLYLSSIPSLALCLIGQLTASSSILNLAGVIHHSFLSTSASYALSIHPHPTIFLQPISLSRPLTATEEFHCKN